MNRTALTAAQTEALAYIAAGQWIYVTDGRTIRSLERRGLITVDRESRSRWNSISERMNHATEIVGMVAA